MWFMVESSMATTWNRIRIVRLMKTLMTKLVVVENLLRLGCCALNVPHA
jgi:hypothetical protein